MKHLTQPHQKLMLKNLHIFNSHSLCYWWKHVCALCIGISLCSICSAQAQERTNTTSPTNTTLDSSRTKRYNLGSSVVVTGSRLPSDPQNPRHLVVTVQRADIERSAARSVEEVLENLAGVDVRQRGPMGVQADVSIRGGTFEQTLVLIDGVKMMDAQTGHHNFNIPLTLDDIERIEVLKGPGSRQYGPNAFAGAINIITRKHKETFARLQAMGGQNGLWEMSASVSAPVRLDGEHTLANRFSISRRRADGYPALDSAGTFVRRPSTDFDILTLAGMAELAQGDLFSLQANASYVEKKFGANSFYSVRFPNQYEETRTLFASLRGTLNTPVPVVATAYWRRNQDYFLLRRENPAFYMNNHTTNTVGVEVQTTLSSALGVTVVGGEAAYDGIVSTNLGTHERTRLSVFAEHQWKPVENVTIEAGATALWNSDWGLNVSPGLDVGWQISDYASVRASVGQAFRVPTYTDLFYRDPSNIGNPNLQPERAWTYELGTQIIVPLGTSTDGLANTINISAAAFRRDARQLIDFIRARPQDPWLAQNISSVITNGVDAHIALTIQSAPTAFVAVERAQLSYTGLAPEFSTDAGLQSKYVLDNLRHHAVGTVDILWAGELTQRALRHQVRVRYEERVGFTGNWFVDTRLAYHTGAWELYGELSNLLNNIAPNLDIIGLPTAGRWLRVGGAVNLASLLK